MKTKELIQISLLTAIIAILAPLSIAIGPIPVSLGTFALYIISLTNKPKNTLVATLLYILLGTFGLPVFAGYKAGLSVLAGPTGGFILGYIPMVILISTMVSKKEDCSFIYKLLLSIVATIACYLCGALWFVFITKATFLYAFEVCILPFILIDLGKMSVCCAISGKLRKVVKKYE